MDIASLGVAASQLSGAQGRQSAGLSGIKSAQTQAQSLINMLTQATQQVAQTQAAAQPVQNASDTGAGNERRLARGSLVNILA
jgi:flagellar hook-basal body complex protein FliE